MVSAKRGMHLVLLVVIASLFAFAASAEESIFNDQILSGESIDIDDFTFVITMNKYASQIFVDAGSMFQTIPFDSCRKMESFRICFENVTYDEEENELYADVQIFRKQPDISISKTINQTDLFIAQEAEMTIKMTNNGDNAENVIMTDGYPVGVEVYDLEGGCQFHENEVYWQGHMDEDEVRTCTFTIKILEELHRSMKAKIKYWDGFKWVEDYSNELTLDIEPLVTFETLILREDYEVDGRPNTLDYDDDDENIFIGEKAKLLINISNNHHEKLTVNSLKINLPQNLRFMSQGHLRFNFENGTGDSVSEVWSSDRIDKISDNLLEWSGTLGDNRSSKLFILDIKGTKTGTHNIFMNLDYSFEKTDFQENEELPLRVNDPGIAIRVTIYDTKKRFSAPVRLSDSDEDEESTEIESLHPYRLTVYTQNKNKFGDVRDVSIKVLTDIAGFKDVFLSEIEAGKQRIPYSFELIPPFIDADKSFKTNVSIDYTNAFGEKLFNSTEVTFDVKKFKDLEISVESEEGFTLEGNEESEITVTLTNDRLVDIPDVFVQDIIDPAFHVEGVHSNSLKLNREEETIVYKYRITPPVVHAKTYLDIITQVSFFDKDLLQDFNFSETNTFTINVLQPDVSVDVTFDEPDDIYPGMIIPATYEISNSEEEELVKDITVHFPVHPGWDLLGPRTFYVDLLEPGESIEIVDVAKYRPKIADDSLELNKTIVEYHDNYGNAFTENTSEESFDVKSSPLTGPALFVETVLKSSMINVSTDTVVQLKVENLGDTETSASVSQGERVWNITVPGERTKTLQYTVRYDQEGNYTIPRPDIKYDYFGQEVYTEGTGADVTVTLLTGESVAAAGAETEMEAEAEKITEDHEEEPKEMSFEEWALVYKKGFRERALKYVLFGVIAIVLLLLAVIFIYFRKGKTPEVTFEGG